LVVHSLAFAALAQPRPLQEFWPLHDEDAVLHALVPLHELMPLHFTPSPALAVDAAVLIANKTAAEATRRERAVMANSWHQLDTASMPWDAPNRKSSLGDKA
jgi:hypothetical protein